MHILYETSEYMSISRVWHTVLEISNFKYVFVAQTTLLKIADNISRDILAFRNVYTHVSEFNINLCNGY